MNHIESILYQSIRWGAILNVGQKLISFTLNQLLLRWTTPEVIGLASVQLELVLSSLLFLSREGIRLALLRESLKTRVVIQRFINLSWVPFSLVIAVSIAICSWQWIENRFNNFESEKFQALCFYVIGAVLEAAGEPWVNVFQNCSQVLPKMRAESVGLLVKSFITFVLIVYLDMGVKSFGVAQIAYGLSYLITLICHTPGARTVSGSAMQLSDFVARSLPVLQKKSSIVDGDDDHDCSLYFGQRARLFAISVTSSCILKHILTEADKIILSLTQSNFDQGIFAVANNYASLVVRTLFLPLEDSSRIALSKLTSAAEGSRVTRKNREALNRSKKMFIDILRIVGLIGIIFPAFGPSYVHVATNYIFSAKWQGSEIEQTLVAFCFYIFVLGINGITEAYVQVMITTGGFGSLNLGLVASFVVYSAVATLFVGRSGTAGVVFAGTCAMVVRIISSFLIIKRCLHNQGDATASLILPLVPSATQFGSLAVVSLMCYISSERYKASKHHHRDAVEHVAIGATLFVVLIAVHRRKVEAATKCLVSP